MMPRLQILCVRGKICALMLVWSVLSLSSGCAALRPEVPRVPSHAIDDAEGTTLGRVFAAQAIEYPSMSGFQVVTRGQLAFMVRAALADSAERTLDLQYYSVGEDLTTDLLLLRIVSAADRGVRVRILLDDIHTSSRLFAWRAVAAHPGIQVRLFNPFFFGGTFSPARLAEFSLDGERLNRRMHNKLWVTDNAAALVGSRNLGDEYFEANDSGNFSDVELLAAGPIVNDLSHAFDLYWNSVSAVPLAAVVDPPGPDDSAPVREALRTRSNACQGFAPCLWLADSGLQLALRSGSVSLSWAPARFIYDQPDQEKSAPASGIEHGWINDHPGGARTHSELLIVSPYFVPSEDGRRHLGEMRERGVRVAVLTNSLASTDSPAAHSGYARHRVALLRTGMQLYELRPEPGRAHRRWHRWGHVSETSLHAKLIVQDRTRVIVGSLNQDPRSRLHNTEAWLAIDSAELAGDLASLFDEGTDLHHAFKVELGAPSDPESLAWATEEGETNTLTDIEPMSSAWLRLWRDVLGAILPEHLL